jgi:LysM repeat protein
MKRILIILTLVLLLGALFVASASAQSLSPELIRVQRGDTLSSIARTYCSTWQDIYRYNAPAIGPNPNNLEPGTPLLVFDRCSPNTVFDRGPRIHATGAVSGNTYTVAAGDTLFSISARFGLNHQVLMIANGLTSTAVLTPGQRLVVPGLNVGVTAPSITIANPRPGAAYNRPYVANGTGQGLFEGALVVQLFDANGRLLQQQETILQGQNVGAGGFGIWEVTFSNIFPQPNTGGRVEAFDPDTGATATTNIWFTGR